MHPIAVFDLDGTLVDTAPDLAVSLNHCLAAEGLPEVELDVIRPHAGHGSRLMLAKAYEMAGVPLSEERMATEVARFLAHYEAHIAERSRPFPGVVAALDRLEAAGWRLAVCTNKFERLARLLLTQLGLADRFAAICGGDTFARRKPDPIHLLGTIERAGAPLDRAVMIGDTSTDTDVARACAVPVILVDFGIAPDARARADADIVIESFDALDGVLAGGLLARHIAP